MFLANFEAMEKNEIIIPDTYRTKWEKVEICPGKWQFYGRTVIKVGANFNSQFRRLDGWIIA